MFLACPALKGRHGFGLILILLMAAAPHVPALAADPAGLRNAGHLGFAATFLVPWLLSRCRRRGGCSVTMERVGGIGLGAIMLAGGLAFVGCAAALPAGAFAWMVPRLVIAAGFLCRWAMLTPERAARQCARNRARFAGPEMLCEGLDRAIIVLFVLTLPTGGEAGAGADPAVVALAQSICANAAAARGVAMLMVGGAALDWLIAVVLVRQREQGRLGFSPPTQAYNRFLAFALGLARDGGLKRTLHDR
jgi:hypothetical protein